MPEPVIRPATTADVPRIASIINDYAERGLMLHRSHAELYERLRDYLVAEVDGTIAGVCGLRIMWANLAEVYALAVAPEHARRGIGKRIVRAVIEQAERIGIRRLFSLTYEQRFFETCGFQVVDRHRSLPLKVWTECVRCPKNQHCDEIAMVLTLEHVPDAAPAGEPSPAAEFDVPVLSDGVRRIERQAGPAT